MTGTGFCLATLCVRKAEMVGQYSSAIICKINRYKRTNSVIDVLLWKTKRQTVRYTTYTTEIRDKRKLVKKKNVRFKFKVRCLYFEFEKQSRIDFTKMYFYVTFFLSFCCFNLDEYNGEIIFVFVLCEGPTIS